MCYYLLLDPKPFVEASVIIRKTEQKNVNHFKLAYYIVVVIIVVVIIVVVIVVVVVIVDMFMFLCREWLLMLIWVLC